MSSTKAGTGSITEKREVCGKALRCFNAVVLQASGIVYFSPSSSWFAYLSSSCNKYISTLIIQKFFYKPVMTPSFILRKHRRDRGKTDPMLPRT